jgi:hypothetical protein
MPCMLEIRSRALTLPETHNLTRLADPLPNSANDCLGHALVCTTPSPPLPCAHTTDT